MKLIDLPDVGRFTIDTVDASYDVDVDARIVTVWHSALDGAGVYAPDATFMFERIVCRVGAPMWFEAFLLDEGADAVRVSTEVLGITPLAVTEVVA